MSDSLRNLADRCLLPGFVGTAAPDWIRRRAAAGLGGVVLYGRNVDSAEQVAALTAALHAERAELLVGIVSGSPRDRIGRAEGEVASAPEMTLCPA